MRDTSILVKRVPSAVKDALKKEAKQQHRSMTAQVIQILEERYGMTMASAQKK